MAYSKDMYPVNSPYIKSQVEDNILFTNFSESPKHLDPARSYSAEEQVFIAQIYEPPYQYHYLLRPYQLVPLSADDKLKVEYFDENGIKLDDISKQGQVEKVATSLYTIKIKQNINYQPHPAFVKNQDGDFKYHNLPASELLKYDRLIDFDYNLSKNNISNTREVLAEDFVYEIKRIADPKNQSPIYSFMANYIIGLSELNQKISKIRQENKNSESYIDLNLIDLPGVKVLDKYTYTIEIKGRYPQFQYWLAMLFFAPIPWEADKFYSQPGLKQNNISLDTYPVGSGPYMLVDNNPNRRMVLEKNPNYQHGIYPNQGMPEDEPKGLLKKAGQKLPFIDRIEFYLEKESIPIWNKFLQGYYDTAGISSDNFDEAIEVINNKLELSEEMRSKEIKLITEVQPTVFYWAFNMLDDTVGGYTEQKIKLRQALAIAFSVEDYINIFRNGRGIVAHSPIPPGIGQQTSDSGQSFNKYLYDNKDTKKSIDYARKLLEEAGYEEGIDNKTGLPLVINFDATTSGSPSEGAVFNWMRQQFDKLGIQLNIRATQYNRFQDKVRSGSAQMYMWGWNADYPDPENFLFLFLCKQGKVKYNGENASNYCNSDFDQLFELMQNSNDESTKKNYVDAMVAILQKDNPWIFGFYNELFQLKHNWMDVSKPLAVGNNNLKYLSIDPKQRLKKQKQWNQPVWWPIILFFTLLVVVITPVAVSYNNRIHKPRERL